MEDYGNNYIQKANEKTIPHNDHQNREKWFDEERKKEIEKRNIIRLIVLLTEQADKQAYKEQRTRAKRLNRQTQRARNKQKVIETKKAIKNFYREIKKGKRKANHTLYISRTKMET